VSATPTIRASAACRLGIAAYGLARSSTRADPWFRGSERASVSTKPSSPNSEGEPSDRHVADEPERVGHDQGVANEEVGVVPAQIQRSATPTICGRRLAGHGRIILIWKSGLVATPGHRNAST
jgi:hypothetical protein